MKSIAFLSLLLTFSGTAIGQSASLAELEEQAFQAAAAAAEPSLVRIETVGGVDLVGDLLTGTGPTTGVVVSADGYIITSSFNFAANPSSILVTLPDEHQYAARVVAEDQSRMLTLLKIDATGLKPLQAAPLEELRVGYWAIALGRTYEIGFPNVSVGKISAFNRVWGRAIQTDAKTSPVNYGGALVDISGRGIGVIVPLSPQQQGETAGIEWYDSGIGFAIPLAEIYRVLPKLKQGQTLKHGLMGVTFADDGPLAGEARIVTVRPESPADKAGLLENDVIAAIDGLPVPRVPMLRQQLGGRYAEETVTLTVKRGEKTLEIPVTLVGELKAYQFPYLGILPKRIAGEEESGGVVLRAVLKDSPAQKAGLAAGDVVTSLGGNPAASAEELAQLLKRHLPGEEVEVGYLHNGEQKTVTLALAPFPDDLPTEIPPPDVPSPEPGAERPKTGRFNEELPGGGARFWALVPDDYNPAATYGLVLWLHPAGDTMEAEIVGNWEARSADRAVIVVGLRASEISGFSPQEEDAAKGVLDWIRQRYRIDPARIAVFGHQEGGAFALRLATKYRDLIRGALVSGAPLRSTPPANDPDFPLKLLFFTEPGTPQSGPISESITFLREMKYPTAALELSGQEELFSPETVEKAVQWVDALDRL